MSGALLVSGGISIYFAYQEQKSALGDLQHEKAIAAASRIEQYVRQIEQQLAYAALPQLDASDVELRRIEFLKLLRQVPEVTDIAQLDADGREQVLVSRLGMDILRSGKDRSEEPAFKFAKRGKAWIGPVYFRKETEPYMTIAVRSGGDSGPVTIADVNLKFIWDVVSRIKIGDKGKAYVVDSSGFLVADPDIGLVLRKTDLSHLPHVRAALDDRQQDVQAMTSRDFGGTPVLASSAKIDALNWIVFAEQPVTEVYAKLNASILFTAALLLAGLVISALCALALARGMVRPIRTLSDGAQRIGEGDLDQTIVVRTGDELEGLADRFNRMTTQLRESYAGLERKVEERTRELQSSLEQQTAISEILRVISSSPTDVQPVLDAVAERAAHLCDAPFARVVMIEGDVLRRRWPSIRRAPRTLPCRASRVAVAIERSVSGVPSLDRVTVHLPDVVPLFDNEFPDARANVRRFGCRTILAVPLVREGGAYGAILSGAARTGPVPARPDRAGRDLCAPGRDRHRQRAPLQRNQGGAREADGDQSEVLKTISRTTFELQPVLETLIENATTAVQVRQGRRSTCAAASRTSMVAAYGAQTDQLEFMRQPSRACRSGYRGRARRADGPSRDISTTRRTDPSYTWKEAQEVFGYRSIFGVPMLREGQPVGVVVMWRTQVRPFSPARARPRRDVCRPGRDRDPERAPAERNEGSARPAACVRRSTCHDFELDRRRRTGVREDPEKLRTPVRRHDRRREPGRRRRARAPGCLSWSGAGTHGIALSAAGR